MTTDLDVLIKRKSDDRYMLVARNYGIVVHSPDLQTGLKELEARAGEVRRDLAEAGVTAELRQPAFEREGKWLGTMMPLVASVLLPWAMIALMIFMAASPLVTSLNRLRDAVTVARQSAEGNVTQAGRSGINWIVRAGDAVDSLPPAQKEELREAVRKIVQGIAPLVDEIRPLFADPKPQPTKS